MIGGHRVKDLMRAQDALEEVNVRRCDVQLVAINVPFCGRGES
jgi:hypothetical protein